MTDDSAAPWRAEFRELAQLVTGQVWQLQARMNVLEMVAQELVLLHAEDEPSAVAWLENFCRVMGDPARFGVADGDDPSKGARIIAEARQAAKNFVQDLARNGKRLRQLDNGEPTSP